MSAVEGSDGVRAGSRGAKMVIALVAAIALLLSPFVAATPAQANPSAGFNPSHIVSDGNFYDGDGMTASEIQSFLNQRVSRCTIGDPGRLPWTPWGNTFIASNCLKDAKFTTASRVANAYCKAYAGGKNEPVSTIISKISKACGISPQVLLVMLEKEQSLITDSWPTARQYDFAMGYACPDSGPNNSANCDPTQTGFPQQVYRAAWQLKVYRAFPNSYNYKPFATNTIQWHPNASCGTSRVYIDNWATAALYIYTPYRPNQAALNAGWGEGDACSSYGNRNFYNFYKQWFGSPTLSVDSRLADLYKSLNGSLGEITGNSVAVGAGIRQELERGTMYWHPNAGAYVLKGGMRTYYDSLGGPSGILGFPTDRERQVLGGYTQVFQNGLVSYASATKRYVVKGSIRAHFDQLGGFASTGFATGSERKVGPGWVQEFDKGWVTSLNGYGRGFISGAMLQGFQQFGGLTVVGYPRGSAQAVPGGNLQEFQNITLYQKDGSAVVPVKGGIRAHMDSIGGVASTGFPVGSERALTNGSIAQEFEAGTLYWSDSGSAFLRPGKIRDYVEANGLGALGGQKSTQVDVGGASYQEFGNATLYWTPSSGYLQVKGSIRKYQASLGGASATGLPTGWQRQTANGSWTQDFELGTIHWTYPDGAFLPRGRISDYVAEHGLSELGSMTAPLRLRAGGEQAEFKNRSLYWSNSAGYVPVKGSIRNYLASIGGVDKTGFPLSAEKKDASGVWTQRFERGTISWKYPNGNYSAS